MSKLSGSDGRKILIAVFALSLMIVPRTSKGGGQQGPCYATTGASTLTYLGGCTAGQTSVCQNYSIAIPWTCVDTNSTSTSCNVCFQANLLDQGTGALIMGNVVSANPVGQNYTCATTGTASFTAAFTGMVGGHTYNLLFTSNVNRQWLSGQLPS